MKIGRWLKIYVDEVETILGELTNNGYRSVFDISVFSNLKSIHEQFGTEYVFLIDYSKTKKIMDSLDIFLVEELAEIDWIKYAWKNSEMETEDNQIIEAFSYVFEWVRNNFDDTKSIESAYILNHNIQKCLPILKAHNINTILLGEGLTPNGISEDLIVKWRNNAIRHIPLDFYWRKIDLSNSDIVTLSSKMLYRKIDELLTNNILWNVYALINGREINGLSNKLCTLFGLAEKTELHKKTRIPLYPNAACVDHNIVYFSTHRDNNVYKYDLETEEIDKVHTFKNISVMQMRFSDVYKINDELIFVPCTADCIVIINLSTKDETIINLKDATIFDDGKWNFINSIMIDNSIWFASTRKRRLFRFDVSQRVYTVFDMSNDKNSGICQAPLYIFMRYCKGKMYLYPKDKRKGLSVDLKSMMFEEFEYDKSIGRMHVLWEDVTQARCCLNSDSGTSEHWNPLQVGTNVYYSPKHSDELLVYSIEKNELVAHKMNIPEFEITSTVFADYSAYKAINYDRKVMLIPLFNNMLVVYNCDNNQFAYKALYRDYKSVLKEQAMMNGSDSGLYAESEFVGLQQFLSTL